MEGNGARIPCWWKLNIMLMKIAENDVAVIVDVVKEKYMKEITPKSNNKICKFRRWKICRWDRDGERIQAKPSFCYLECGLVGIRALCLVESNDYHYRKFSIHITIMLINEWGIKNTIHINFQRIFVCKNIVLRMYAYVCFTPK